MIRRKKRTAADYVELAFKYGELVVNRRETDDWDVYIGHGSKWGNPATALMKADTLKDRVLALEEFDNYVWESGLINDIHELKGMRLG